MRLQLEDIWQSYDRRAVLRGLSFTLAAGEIGCLLGPSACGKTTVLRVIAGFEDISNGRILTDGQVQSGPDTFVPAHERGIAMVFQDYALFPHLDVRRNVMFGLHRLPAAEQQSRVGDMLGRFGLEDVAGSYPHEISGGQQQRVALARALGPGPGLILLDEPFSSLDTDLKESSSREVRDVLKDLGATALIVTHDQSEAFAMADKVGVMEQGTIRQWDTPYDLYHRPANRFIADFVGEGVVLPGVVGDQGRIDIGFVRLEGTSTSARQAGDAVDVLLRPDDVIHDSAGPLSASIVARAFRGADILYTLRLDDGTEILALMPSHENHPTDSRISFRVATKHVVTFPAS